MSAEDLPVAPPEPSNGSVGTLSDDELLDVLNRERAARLHAERLYVERDEAVARLQGELRDLGRLRDNFHSLYREERELRTEADRIAAERSEERDALQSEVILLRSDVDRLDRMVSRYQAQRTGTAAPAAAPAAEAPSAAADSRVHELEREAGMLRAHAAELENAIAERTASVSAANRRITELEREVAMARTELAGAEPGEAADTAVAAANRRIAELESELATLHASHQAVQSGRSEHAAELAAALRRVHDLDGELATLRAEHADLRSAHDRTAAARDSLKQAIGGEQAQREEAQRFAASAEQRVQDAVTREQEAVRAAHQHRATAEHAENELQAARATISVLEKRVHDAEAARTTAEQRSTELAEELNFMRSSVLNSQSPAPAKRTLLRRREVNGNGKHAAVHVETVGTAVGADAHVEVSGVAEDVESALHRRLFGGE